MLVSLDSTKLVKEKTSMPFSPLYISFLSHEQQRHGLFTDDGGDENRDSFGYYKCRGPCSLVFATESTRKRCR